MIEGFGSFGIPNTIAEATKKSVTGALAFAAAILGAEPEQPTPLKTKLFCVLYDAGETNALLPVLKRLETEGKDFRVLVMATAETIIKPDQFPGKRLTLKDVCVNTLIDTKTPRQTPLSKEEMEEINKRINPNVVLVGTASKIQEQVLQHFPCAVRAAFVDNFDYDKTHESFATVQGVKNAAQHVFVPSTHTMKKLGNAQEKNALPPLYYIVGKPTLETWNEEKIGYPDQSSTTLITNCLSSWMT